MVPRKETTKEQVAAELLDKLNGLFEGEDSLPKTIDRVKLLAEEVEELKGLNLDKTVEEFDKLKATQETLKRMIKSSKSGLYVPGLEDEAEKFSFLRAMVAVRTGDWNNAGFEKEVFDNVRTKASHVVGDDSTGGYFVPDQIIPEVIAAIYTASVFINLSGDGTTLISVVDGLVGGNVKIPKFDGGTIAYWIGEEDDYAESITSMGDVTLNPKKLGVLIRITDTMRRLAGFGFETLLRNDMIRAAAKRLDWTIPYGRGTADMPRGIMHHREIKF